MSDDPKPEAAAPEGEGAGAAKPAKGPNKLLLPLVVTLMTVIGGVVGVLVIAPKLLARQERVQEGLDAPEGEGAAEGEGGGHGEAAGGRGPIFKIDNLIVNPTGSQGTRFLMVSVAVETPDAEMEEHLRQREAQIRDLAITLLEKQTMETLSQEGIRDSLKIQLGDTISAMVGAKGKLRVFLPQFVIQ